MRRGAGIKMKGIISMLAVICLGIWGSTEVHAQETGMIQLECRGIFTESTRSCISRGEVCIVSGGTAHRSRMGTDGRVQNVSDSTRTYRCIGAKGESKVIVEIHKGKETGRCDQSDR